MAENKGISRSAYCRPTPIVPTSAPENIFRGGSGSSPGPMTLASSFFPEGEEYKSFSELLAGAMSPAANSARKIEFFQEDSPAEKGSSVKDEKEHKFKQRHPFDLVMAPSPLPFAMPPGLSPAGFLDSPMLFPPGPGPFGMSHQQALAQVTAQASLSHSLVQTDSEHPSATVSCSSILSSDQMQNLASDSRLPIVESLEVSHSKQRSQASTLFVDKQEDDAYNWRKYGQKKMKGSERPRAYYKCTHADCTVKKKVECSLDGQVTIIYKGNHNHLKPQNKRNRGHLSSGLPLSNAISDVIASSETELLGQTHRLNRREQEVGNATPEALSSLSDCEDAELTADDGVDNELDPKRRRIDLTETVSSHRTVTEPRVILQTTSEVDLLDDGYKWRKYGQKAVKGNHNPRSYYKCTYPGCTVRKHVERASSDAASVITTYEGKHNHDVPASRNSSHNTTNPNSTAINTLRLKQDSMSHGYSLIKEDK